MELTTYEAVAKAHKLDELTASRFIRYMKARWADKENIQCRCGYASEWAERFQNKIEYGCSDTTGQAVLRAIDGGK